MKLLVFLLILILALYTLSRKTCYSSGDPHFKTFHGYTPDLYGVTGDLLLTRAKDHTFSVITRVRYGKHWANRGLNSAISVKIDGNIYNNYGSYWEVNGVKNGKFINNVEFKNSGTHHYISSRKTGQHVEFRWYYVGHFNGFTDYYFNVYLSIPDKYYGKMVGLCGNGAGDFKSDVKNWQHWTSAKKGKKFFRCVLPLKNQHNHFDVKYVPKPSQHVFEKIKWKNEEQKNKAHEYCYEKLKLRNNLYKDCVYDVKVGGGDMSMAKGYKTAAKDIKHVDGSKKKIRNI